MQIKSWHLALTGMLFYLAALLPNIKNYSKASLAIFDLILRFVADFGFYLFMSLPSFLFLLASVILLKSERTKKFGGILSIVGGSMAAIYFMRYYQWRFSEVAYISSFIMLFISGCFFFFKENKTNIQIKSWHLALLGFVFYLASVVFSLQKSDPDMNLAECGEGIFRVMGADYIYLLPLLVSMLLLQTGTARKLAAVIAIFTGFMITVGLIYSIAYYQKVISLDSAAFLLSSLSLTSAGLIFFWAENKKVKNG